MVKKGYKQTEIGVIPEDWEVKPLKVVAPLQRGFDLPYSSIKDGIYPVVFSNGIGAYHSSYMVKGPGVVMGRSGTIGKIHYVKSDYWPHNTTLWVTDFHNNDPLFASYLFKTIPWNLYNSGSGVPTLNRNDVQDYLVAIPSPKEQTEIAAILSDVDTLINSLKRQIVKKKAIKQGAMQELLTGKKRLPGFSGDWIKSNIGSCIIEKPSYGINAPAVDFNGFLPRYIRITDISKDGRYCKDAQASVSAENVEPFLLKTNDIVLARTGASVGKSYIYDEHDGRLVYAGFLIKMSIDPQKADSRFIFGVLHTYDYWKWVAQTSMRSGQPGINGEEYASYEFRMPSDLKEQKAIADILTNMDNEIVTLGKKLIKYRQVKQGMMQQLLTGKIRLV
jgi:type I restriction enzyme S subunit